MSNELIQREMKIVQGTIESALYSLKNKVSLKYSWRNSSCFFK